MADIVILGAGIGGLPMAYDMRKRARPEDKVIVVSNVDYFHFVPSNPWIAVNWRKRDDIQFPLAPYLSKKGIDFIASGAKRLHPDENRLELVDGRSVHYDYLVIATGATPRKLDVPGSELDGVFSLRTLGTSHGRSALPSRAKARCLQCQISSWSGSLFTVWKSWLRCPES
jgi:sulfide:quinone oxidoreductase